MMNGQSMPIVQAFVVGGMFPSAKLIAGKPQVFRQMCETCRSFVSRISIWGVAQQILSKKPPAMIGRADDSRSSR